MNAAVDVVIGYTFICGDRKSQNGADGDNASHVTMAQASIWVIQFQFCGFGMK